MKTLLCLMTEQLQDVSSYRTFCGCHKLAFSVSQDSGKFVLILKVLAHANPEKHMTGTNVGLLIKCTQLNCISRDRLISKSDLKLLFEGLQLLIVLITI